MNLIKAGGTIGRNASNVVVIEALRGSIFVSAVNLPFEGVSDADAAPLIRLAEKLGLFAAQTIAAEQPKEEDLRRAFSDLLISEEMYAMLGPAINSGRGMFLYGYPGNGKTSLGRVLHGGIVGGVIGHFGLQDLAVERVDVSKR